MDLTDLLATQYVERALPVVGDFITLTEGNLSEECIEARDFWISPPGVPTRQDVTDAETAFYRLYSQRAIVEDDPEEIRIVRAKWDVRMRRGEAFAPVWDAAVRRAVIAYKRDTFISQGMDFEAAEIAAALSMSH